RVSSESSTGRPISAYSYYPITCLRSRSRRSCCSSRRSAASSSGNTRVARYRVLGPSVAWYLAVAAFLFSTGALGVLLRRNPLIVLLSLEIMLNGANLALIGYARRLGDRAGQTFAIAVLAAAASHGVVGLRLGVA